MCTGCKSPSQRRQLRRARVAAAHSGQVTGDRCALCRTVERAAHRPMPLQIAGAAMCRALQGTPAIRQQPRSRVDWIFASFGLWAAPPRLSSFVASRGRRHDLLAPVGGLSSGGFGSMDIVVLHLATAVAAGLQNHETAHVRGGTLCC
jgi:hypothetical protein